MAQHVYSHSELADRLYSAGQTLQKIGEELFQTRGFTVDKKKILWLLKSVESDIRFVRRKGGFK